MEDTHLIEAGYATIGQGAGPLIVTERAGLFAKYGLQVKTRLMQGAKGVVQGLMSGKIQFGNLAAPALLRAGLVEGADVVFLTGGINQQFLVSRPGLESRGELSGRKVGFIGDGSLTDVLVDFIVERLEKEGIINIKLVQIPSRGRDCITYLIDHKCDAVVMTPPEAMEAKRKGCRFLVDFADYALNFALGGIAARRSYIREHTEITRQFLRAYVEGLHRYRTDRTFTVDVQREYSGLTDISIAEETYDRTQPGMPEVPYPALNALGVALRVMSKQLPVAATVDPSRFVDDRFIRELDKSGFIASLYGG